MKFICDDVLIKNYNAIIESLEKEKSNNTLKGDLIRSAFVTSTMGVSYKLKLGKNIRFNRNSLIIPKPLGLIYALGYLISRGVKKVYLAGFDGFEADNPFKDETQVYINHLKKSFKNFKIISLTKTKLNF